MRRVGSNKQLATCLRGQTVNYDQIHILHSIGQREIINHAESNKITREAFAQHHGCRLQTARRRLAARLSAAFSLLVGRPVLARDHRAPVLQPVTYLRPSFPLRLSSLPSVWLGRASTLSAVDAASIPPRYLTLDNFRIIPWQPPSLIPETVFLTRPSSYERNPPRKGAHCRHACTLSNSSIPLPSRSSSDGQRLATFHNPPLRRWTLRETP
jgi:hypothetical protein